MSQDVIREVLRKEKRAMTLNELAEHTGLNGRTVAMQVNMLNKWHDVEVSYYAGKKAIKLRITKQEKRR